MGFSLRSQCQLVAFGECLTHAAKHGDFVADLGCLTRHLGKLGEGRD